MISTSLEPADPARARRCRAGAAAGADRPILPRRRAEQRPYELVVSEFGRPAWDVEKQRLHPSPDDPGWRANLRPLPTIEQPEAREWVNTARSNRLAGRPGRTGIAEERDDPHETGRFSQEAPRKIDAQQAHQWRLRSTLLSRIRQPARQSSQRRASDRRTLDQPLSELLAQALATQGQQTLYFQQTLVQRDLQVAELEARTGWLEGQAREARRALAAVENGRVMRICGG